MKRNFLISAFVLASFFTFSFLKAQPVLSMAYDSLNWVSPPGQTFGDSINYTFSVLNVGDTTFNGDISILRQVNGGVIDTLQVATGRSIIPNDTDSFSIDEVISNARFGGGINIIVVWPAAPATLTGDSAWAEYEITPLAVDPSLAAADPIDIFPNPTQQHLRLRYNFPAIKLASVHLFDQQGRLVQQVHGAPTELDVGHLPNGIYILQTIFRDGQERRFKLVVQH